MTNATEPVVRPPGRGDDAPQPGTGLAVSGGSIASAKIALEWHRLNGRGAAIRKHWPPPGKGPGRAFPYPGTGV